MSGLSSFFAQYYSKATGKTYGYALKAFFKSVYGEDADYRECAEKYFDENRDYESDIRTFFATINERPPKSVNMMLAGVKSYLMENDVELKQMFWRRLRRRIRGTRAVTQDKVPSNAELRSRLIHMPRALNDTNNG